MLWLRYPSLLLIVLTALGAMGLSLLEMPQNEFDALTLLRDGSLEYSEYVEIVPLYIRKLSVPQGELRFLPPVLSNEIEDVPVHKEELAQYMPWDSSSVERFFNEYEDLRLLAPILCFDTISLPRIGALHYSISGIDSSYQPSVTARFSTSNLYPVRVIGDIAMESTYMRFKRRALIASIGKTTIVTVGNFPVSWDHGFFLGRYPVIDTLSIRDNWLYGEIASPNGVQVQTSIHRYTHLDAFIHSDLLRFAGGALYRQGFFRGMLTTSLGMTGLVNKVNSGLFDTTLFVMTGIAGNMKNERFGADVALLARHKPSFAWYAFYEQAIVNTRIACYAAHLGAGWNVPSSSVRHRLFDAVDIEDSVPLAVSSVSLRSSTRLSDNHSVATNVRYAYGTDRAAVNLSTSLTFRNPSLTLSYGYYPVLFIEDSEKHRMGCSWSFHIGAQSILSAAVNGYINGAGYKSLSASLKAAIDVIPRISFVPTASMYAKNSEKPEYLLGCEQQMHVIKNISCGLSVRTAMGPIVFSNNSVRAYAHFDF